MIWNDPPPSTLEEKAAYLVAHHEHCDGHDSCSCFDRLLAAVRGEDDPAGMGWEDKPEFGPPSPSMSQWIEMGVDPKTLPFFVAMEGHLKDHYAAYLNMACMSTVLR